MSAHCPKCLVCGLREDKIGTACDCGGIIERMPEWKELVDVLPEPVTCPDRLKSFGPWDRAEGLDRWEQFKAPHRQKVCSFCGSLSFEDFEKLVLIAANEPEDKKYSESVGIEPSDKQYKIYVRVPGIRNAHEGGIKFYMWHCPKNPDGTLAVTEAQHAMLSEAVRRSTARFNQMLYGRRESMKSAGAPN